MESIRVFILTDDFAVIVFIKMEVKLNIGLTHKQTIWIIKVGRIMEVLSVLHSLQ